MKTYKQLITEAAKLPRDVAYMLKATVESKKAKVWIEKDEWSSGVWYLGQAKRGKAWNITFASFDMGMEAMHKAYKTEEEARAAFASLKTDLTYDEIWSTWYRKK
jgi:hypothetical protein